MADKETRPEGRTYAQVAEEILEGDVGNVTYFKRAADGVLWVSIPSGDTPVDTNTEFKIKKKTTTGSKKFIISKPE